MRERIVRFSRDDRSGTVTRSGGLPTRVRTALDVRLSNENPGIAHADRIESRELPDARPGQRPAVSKPPRLVLHDRNKKRADTEIGQVAASRR